MKRTLPLLGLLLGLSLLTGTVDAQHVLTASTETVLPGAPVTVRVLLDNPDPVRGFSFGLTHAAGLLTLNAIDPGAEVADANGGSGPAFFFTDTTPAGGSGGVVGCILSLSSPLDEIPVGTSNEIVLFDYQAAGAADPASVSSHLFVDTLGSPAVEIVVDVAGITQVPSLVPGQVTILTPAVTNISCSLVDICDCVFDLTWTNAIAYDQIQILDDGVLVQTLGGSATATSVDIGGFGSATLGVVGIRNGQAAVSTECGAVCPTIPPPVAPTALNCSVDSTICEATITWSNPESFDLIEVSLDGTLVATLGGASTLTTVTLPGVGVYEVCLTSRNVCGVPSPLACCTVECLQAFVRGDTNQDGGFNISDAIQELDVLFGSGTTTCDDSLDVDDDDSLGLTDVFFILDALFTQGPLPQAPFPGCGFDPTVGTLSCDSFGVCP